MAGLRIQRIGYFGKVPSTGDFVARNIDRGVREAIDKWLQASLEESRQALGDAWLHSFLTAPVWRFAIGGLVHGRLVLGVMIPSVDKVGRYFPFLVVAELLPAPVDRRTLVEFDLMLDLLEPLALSVLDDDFDLDYLTSQLAGAERQLAAPVAPPMANAETPVEARNAQLEQALNELDWREASIWWTEGGDYRGADMILGKGLPNKRVFAALLRDPNIFRDLEHVWDECRHLALSQFDNGQIDLKSPPAGITDFACISHPGKQGRANPGYVHLLAHSGTMAISDGRFGVKPVAMASRMICRSLPALWKADGNGFAVDDLQRLSAFLAGKTSSQKSSVLPMLSFAFVSADHEAAGRVHVVCAGDYLCLLARGERLTRLFATGAESNQDTPTIRLEPSGLYSMVSLDLAPGDRLLIANNTFTHRALSAPIAEALALGPHGSTARSIFEEALIKGIDGNLCLGMVGAAPPVAEG